MAIDLRGGIELERELLLAEAPTTPGLREAVNIWAWDDSGEFGIPRVAIDAIGPDWSTFDVSMNLTFADGRTLRFGGREPSRPTIGPDGTPTVLSAGPLTFECLEPFKRYRMVFDGKAADSNFRGMVAHQPPAREAEVFFEIFYEPSVPPWIQGTMSEDANKVLSDAGIEREAMGGDRWEQLCRARGVLRVDGAERPISGGALRIRRRGVRNDAGFWGHCWQSAQFPSGRAFGCNVYPPRADGQPTYNEGFLFLGDGELIPARVVEAPWITHFQTGGEDVSLVLESRLGRTRIEAVSVSGMPLIAPAEMKAFPPLLEAIARYRWDGEEAYGMIERSNLRDNVRNLG